MRKKLILAIRICLLTFMCLRHYSADSELMPYLSKTKHEQNCMII